MNETDQIHQARQGDEQAWASLVQQQQDAVFRLAYLLVGDVGGSGASDCCVAALTCSILKHKHRLTLALGDRGCSQQLKSDDRMQMLQPCYIHA